MTMRWDGVDDPSRGYNQQPEQEYQVDVGQMCRLCAEFSDDLVPMFGESKEEMNLVDKIHTHLPIKVTSEDFLPLSCCGSCITKLNVCHELVNLCLEADWKIRSLLQCHKVAYQLEDKEENPIEKEVLPDSEGSSTSQSNNAISTRDLGRSNCAFKEIDEAEHHFSHEEEKKKERDAARNGMKNIVQEDDIKACIKNKRFDAAEIWISNSPQQKKEWQKSKKTKRKREESEESFAYNGEDQMKGKQKYKVVLVKLRNSAKLSKAVQVEKALEILKRKQETGKLPEAKGPVPKRLQQKLQGLKTYGLLKPNKSIRLPLEPKDYQIEDSAPLSTQHDSTSPLKVDIFSCTFCEKIFMGTDALNSHESDAHQNIIFCYCSKTFETQEMLDEHLKTHVEEESERSKSRLTEEATRSEPCSTEVNYIKSELEDEAIECKLDVSTARHYTAQCSSKSMMEFSTTEEKVDKYDAH